MDRMILDGNAKMEGTMVTGLQHVTSDFGQLRDAKFWYNAHLLDLVDLLHTTGAGFRDVGAGAWAGDGAAAGLAEVCCTTQLIVAGIITFIFRVE